MQVLFFGRLADAAGARREIDTGRFQTVGDVTHALAQDPELGALIRAPSVRTILDHDIVDAATPLGQARELAYLPPVSGG